MTKEQLQEAYDTLLQNYPVKTLDTMIAVNSCLFPYGAHPDGPTIEAVYLRNHRDMVADVSSPERTLVYWNR